MSLLIFLAENGFILIKIYSQIWELVSTPKTAIKENRNE